MGTEAKTERSIRLVHPPDDRGVAAFAITQGKKTSHYTVKEILCEIGGRGFAVHRTGVGTRYDVRIGEPSDTSCECMGYLAHGYCKHISGLTAIIRQGLLPPRTTSANPSPSAPQTDSAA